MREIDGRLGDVLHETDSIIKANNAEPKRYLIVEESFPPRVEQRTTPSLHSCQKQRVSSTVPPSHNSNEIRGGFQSKYTVGMAVIRYQSDSS